MQGLATILEQIANGDADALRRVSNEFRQKVEVQAQVIREQSAQSAPTVPYQRFDSELKR